MIPQTAILDTSVVILWYLKIEHISEIAYRIRNGYLLGYIKLAIPDFVFYETEALLIQILLKDKQTLINQTLSNLHNLKLNELPLTVDILHKAIEISSQESLNIYDAYLLSLAKKIDYEIITANEKQYRSLRKYHRVKYLLEV